MHSLNDFLLTIIEGLHDLKLAEVLCYHDSMVLSRTFSGELFQVINVIDLRNTHTNLCKNTMKA